MGKSKKVNWPKMLGQSVFFASLQSALGSVEMSSKFSVINFCKDQETLQNAADALRGYLYIAGAWTIATMLVMYAQYGWIGAMCGLVANMLFLAWIYFSYMHSFNVAVEKGKDKGLTQPIVFF